MATLRVPQQARSRATYERLLDAAQVTMAEKGFDAVSVQEIADTAGLTIGAFYARFPNKEALLIGFTERLSEHSSRLLQMLQEFAETGPPLNDLISRFVHELAKFYANYRQILRPLRRNANTNPTLKAKTKNANKAIKRELIKYLNTAADEIQHPNPKLALNTVITIVFSTLRMQAVEDDLLPKDFQSPQRALVEQLAKSMVMYLSSKE